MTGALSAPLPQCPGRGRNSRDLRKNPVKHFLRKSELNSYNTDTFLEFLKALIHDAENPVFLILDNHPVHHAKRVRAYVESLQGKLKLFFLPAYSPELNPDESVWGYIKYHHVGKQVINNKEQLKEIVYRQLRRLQKLPALLKSFL